MPMTRPVRALSVLILLVGATGCGSQQQAAAPVTGDTPSKTASSACPSANALDNFQEASNVTASFATDATHVTTYVFTSVTNESPVGGVPGLIKYCVYPSGGVHPTSVTPTADAWLSVNKDKSDSFSFVRPGGNPTNIPLDGKTTTMGTASWATLPTDQTILLHVNDPTLCASLYPSDNPGTCFVKPIRGAICEEGDKTLAYNAIPFGAADCQMPSEAFEAQSVSEFGDEVQLEAGTPRGLKSLRVLFSSYACNVSGSWNGNCVSDLVAQPTYQHSITGNVYAVADCSGTPCKGALLASVTQVFDIPYRPSADPTCLDPAQWFNPLAPPAGACQFSKAKVLEFTFSQVVPVTLPENVIWTVAFDTSHYGENPITPGSDPREISGHPYDSLNVGAKTFAGSPYAGTDVDPHGAFLNSSWAGAYCDLQPGGVLRLDTSATDCWDGYTPLGAIVTQ